MLGYGQGGKFVLVSDRNLSELSGGQHLVRQPKAAWNAQNCPLAGFSRAGALQREEGRQRARLRATD